LFSPPSATKARILMRLKSSISVPIRGLEKRLSTVKRQKVVSSNLRSVGYDEAARVLEVEFQNGRVYRYLDVPREVYEELMSADSLGRYFNEYIRESYQYSRAA
jgi:hypothetical protein